MAHTPVRIDRRLFLKGLSASSLVFQGSLVGLTASCGPDEDTGDEAVFYFAVVTDSHVQGTVDHVNNQVFAQTLDLIGALEVPVDFVVMTGDLVDELPSDDPAHYAEHDDTALHHVRRILDDAPMPVHLIMGNHDYYIESSGIDNQATDVPLAREALFQEFLGMPAPWYRVDHEGIAFYCLSSMQKDDRVTWSPGGCGSFGEEQLTWLEEQLADGVPAFLFFHHPLALDVMVNAGMMKYSTFEVPRSEGNYEKYEGTQYEDWTDPIYAMLEEHADQVLAVFVGHGHWFVEDSYEGIPVMMGDSAGNSVQMTTYEGEPMRYHLVECNLSTGEFSIYNRAWISGEG